MAYNYMVPTVGILPRGYDARLDPALERVGKYLGPGPQRILWRIKVFHDGAEIHAEEWPVAYEDGRALGPLPAPFGWPRARSAWGEDVGFYECDFVTADGTPGFTRPLQPVTYVSFSAPGRKSFLSNRSYKFASPPTIDQIAAYGQFIDSFPAIHIDKARDFGESLVMINPYRRDIIAKILTHDGRRIERIRIRPRAARLVRLDGLLADGETAWQGRLQLSANNRVITYDLKHSFAEPEVITDEEHLDPYRADPTHLPAFQWLRQAIGRELLLRGRMRG